MKKSDLIPNEMQLEQGVKQMENFTSRFMASNGSLKMRGRNVSQDTVSDFRTATFYCALLMLFCCIIGSLGNIASFWVFTRRCMRSSPINVLLAALSAVDLAMLITAVPVFVIPSLNTFLYNIDPGELYRIIVTGFYQAIMIGQTCSVWTFVSF